LKHSKFETSYSLPINNDILVAAIDMMIFNEQGEVIICDWKTNRTRTPEDISESYRLQMLCYAYIVSFIFPLQNEFECKLLLTRLAKPNAEDLDWIFTFKFTKEDIAGFESILKENANYIKYPIRKMNKFNYFS